MTSSTEAVRPKRKSPRSKATPRSRSVDARESGKPMAAMSSTLAVAKLPGEGASRSRRTKGVFTGRPYFADKRDASVEAPVTLTCWPSTARTASSNVFHAPGTRRPG
jgi:hypothetical protein